MNKNKAYSKYVELQKTRYCSLESDNQLWKKGQERFIDINFGNTARDVKLLDIACGDGVGLKYFKKLGFSRVVGGEFNKVKIDQAKKVGFPVYNLDMHDLSRFADGTFEVVYSSHTIEHAFDVKKAVLEMRRILVDIGQMVVVLPYPDRHLFNLEAHVAKATLGTNIDDGGRSVKRFFRSCGLRVLECRFDYYREPEIWLKLVKI